MDTDRQKESRVTYGPPDVIVRGVLHGHVTHLLQLLAGAAAGEERQVVAPDLRVVPVILQGPRQGVQRRIQTFSCRATKQSMIK